MTGEEPIKSRDQALALLEEGRRDLLEGRYFEAHDVWEDLWQSLRGPDRPYLQALIHIAVGAYHRENGNAKGTRSQWTKAIAKLSSFPRGHWGIDLSEWIGWLTRYLDGDENLELPGDLPFEPEEFPDTLPLATS